MDILFYRYNSIYEPDVISVFHAFGLNVIEEKTEMTDKKIKPGEIAKIVADHILNRLENGKPFLFVFSINFFPAISEVCEKFNVLYVCWSVDCPVLELFSKSICNRHNRIFLFDKTQYERFHPHNPDCIFYLPLATNVDRLDRTISTITSADRQRFSADISFVGSLYSEKNPLKNVKNLNAFTKGYIDALVNAQLQIYGYNFIEDVLSDEVIMQLKNGPLDMEGKNLVEPIARYVAAHSYIGMTLAEEERLRTLTMLSQNFHVDLYTRSDVSGLPDVHMRGAAKSLSEMPKVFHLSKINLNMTIRSIQTGLPLRIFDVLGSGGFLITNYQAELPELFEIGKDLEVYSSLDELREKCDYYLTHEEERRAIAKNGYEKVKQLHNCTQRMTQLLSYILH